MAEKVTLKKADGTIIYPQTLLDVSGNYSTSEGAEAYSSGAMTRVPIPLVTNNVTTQVMITIDNTNVTLTDGNDRSGASGYVTLWYTKSS